MLSWRTLNRAFTLIELLIVIAIIGLLASVILVALQGARAKGRDAKRVLEIRELKTALELYFSNHGAYPNLTTWPNDCSDRVGIEPRLSSALSALVTEGYIGQIPTDPSAPSNPWPQCYYYEANDTCRVGDGIHPYIIIFHAESPMTGYTSWNNESNRYCVYP